LSKIQSLHDQILKNEEREDPKPEPAADVQQKLQEIDRKLNGLKDSTYTIGRQLILDSMAAKESTRSTYNSGIKQVRTHKAGLKSYHTNTYTGRSFMSIHDHANNMNTLGMGEFVANLNGVEFRTRHNDYKLTKPHSTSAGFHENEDITPPDVPPAVLEKATVEEQIIEMREWFKAFGTSDHSVRDYRKYFKPVMCYLEGSWLKVLDDSIDEPFESDRHFIDAEGLFDLQEKNRYTAYTGSKSLKENLSYMPTTILEMDEQTGQPTLAKWNYRIACHEIKRDMPVNLFRAEDDLPARMREKETFEKYVRSSRAVRFQLNTHESKDFHEKPETRTIIDEIMEEIPGKDNYQGDLTDHGINAKVLNIDDTPKNAASYHRFFSLQEKDAMGDSINHRGFSDATLWMAMTTQDRVAGPKFKVCPENTRHVDECITKEDKWSYAIPLEVVYLTPLQTWNPYNIPFKEGNEKKAKESGKNGKCTSEGAYTYVWRKHFSRTPAAFFRDSDTDKLAKDNADTSSSARGCFKDANGDIHKLEPSGVRIYLPWIDGVGSLRTRYPIAPLTRDGQTTYKHFEALKDILMNPNAFKFMGFSFENGTTHNGANSGGAITDPDKLIKFKLAPPTNFRKSFDHTHELEITKADLVKMKANKSYRMEGVITSEAEDSQGNTHTHRLNIKYDPEGDQYVIYKCDNKGRRCEDTHPLELIPVDEE